MMQEMRLPEIRQPAEAHFLHVFGVAWQVLLEQRRVFEREVQPDGVSGDIKDHEKDPGLPVGKTPRWQKEQKAESNGADQEGAQGGKDEFGKGKFLYEMRIKNRNRVQPYRTR